MLGRHGTVVDCQEIEPGLVIGRLATCADLPRGINAVLNLCAEAQPMFMDNQPEPLESWRGGDLWAYARMGILDGDYPGLIWLETAINQVLTWRVNGWRVLIVCAAGISRSAMVMCGVLMTTNGYTLEQALKVIREKRSQVQPNPSFTAGLLEFQAGLASKWPEGAPPGGLTVLNGEVKSTVGAVEANEPQQGGN